MKCLSPVQCRHLGGRAPHARPRVFVGADCAGLNLGCIALETLGIDAQSSFAFEKDKATRSMRKHNFDIETTQVSHDIMERDDSTLPLVDL